MAAAGLYGSTAAAGLYGSTASDGRLLAATASRQAAIDFLTRLAGAEKRDISRRSTPRQAHVDAVEPSHSPAAAAATASALEEAVAATLTTPPTSSRRENKPPTTATGATPTRLDSDRPGSSRLPPSRLDSIWPSSEQRAVSFAPAAAVVAVVQQHHQHHRKAATARRAGGTHTSRSSGWARLRATAPNAVPRSTNAALASLGIKVVGPIAAGAFSTVLRAKHLASGEEVAVKTFEVSKSVDDAQQAETRDREMRMLRLVSAARHAHIANLLDEKTSAVGVHACLYYCGGGSLQSYLLKLRRKQMSMAEGEAALATSHIASALDHIHSLGVAHRDVKPANILYDGRGWRLCDFGFAVLQSHEGERLTQRLGTLSYCAPEMLSMHEGGSSSSGSSGSHGSGGGYVGARVDMWAFGCTLYEMRVGRPCFVSETEEATQLRIKNGFKGGSTGQPWLPHMKREKSLISALLVKSPPDERLTAAQVLKHKWITQHCKAPTPASDLVASKPLWWCDVATEWCLRPSQPTHAGQYSDADLCYVHPNGNYMVCAACYRTGRALDQESLRLRLSAAACVALAEPPEAAQDADNDEDGDVVAVTGGGVDGDADLLVAKSERRDEEERDQNTVARVATLEPVAEVDAETEEVVPPPPRFLPSARFDGARPGYCFTTRENGVGYYWDVHHHGAAAV